MPSEQEKAEVRPIYEKGDRRQSYERYILDIY